MLGNPVTMAASLSSPPPCSTPLITQKPCFRLDLGREFLKSFDLGLQRPLNLRSLESSKELVVSANSNNAVSVTDPAPSLTRITDFGLARLVGSRDSNDSSFVNGDLGEIGYVAPEYSSTMVASLKGDVYGFGVVLLELITGQKPLEISNVVEGFKGNLVDWVSHLSNTGRSVDAIDNVLAGKGHDDEILQFMRVACTCVVARPKDRPSMHQVYESLKSLADKHGFSEQYDEFPLMFGKQVPES